jgi:hypothetical protein
MTMEQQTMLNEVAQNLMKVKGNLPQFRWEFAEDLAHQQLNGKKPLSEKQVFWLNKLFEMATETKLEPRKVDLGISVAGIIALFDKAAAKLKWPQITIKPVDDVVLRMSRAGSGSQYPGTVVVKQRDDYGEFRYLGRITLDGQYMPYQKQGVEQPAILEDFLQEFAADPQTVAAEYGKRSGYCCFCNSELTDERSLHVGYGPVCADHYGMHYPKKSELN